MNAIKATLFSLVIIGSSLFISSCSNDDQSGIIAPKPRGYYRLTFPEKEYIKYDSTCPYTFERPIYSKMGKDENSGAQPCWLNVYFPSFNGTLHLTYNPVNNNVQKYLEDTYTLASKHQIKASGIEERRVVRDSSNIYGLIYEIEGNAASAMQFYLTDSTNHFIRGALYFNEVPNIDSIAPVLSFIKKDIYHMIETFEWKNIK